MCVRFTQIYILNKSTDRKKIFTEFFWTLITPVKIIRFEEIENVQAKSHCTISCKRDFGFI